MTKDHERTVVQVAFLAGQILSYLPRAMPDYTDHGVKHSKNLIEIFSNFLQNLPQFRVDLEEEEKWLICLAIWLHDIGILITNEEEKEKHNENSVKMLNGQDLLVITNTIDQDICTCLKYVIKYHSSHTDLAQVPKDKIHPKIRLPLACAVFRLLDGCDITAKRIPPVLYSLLKTYGLLKAPNLPFWEAHRNINSAVFQKDELVIDCDNITPAQEIIDHLKEDIAKINKVLTDGGFPQFTVRVVEQAW